MIYSMTAASAMPTNTKNAGSFTNLSMLNAICFPLIAICEKKENVTDQMHHETKNKGHRPGGMPEQDDAERGHESAYLQPERKALNPLIGQGVRLIVLEFC